MYATATCTAWTDVTEVANDMLCLVVTDVEVRSENVTSFKKRTASLQRDNNIYKCEINFGMLFM